MLVEQAHISRADGEVARTRDRHIAGVPVQPSDRLQITEHRAAGLPVLGPACIAVGAGVLPEAVLLAGGLVVFVDPGTGNARHGFDRPEHSAADQRAACHRRAHHEWHDTAPDRGGGSRLAAVGRLIGWIAAVRRWLLGCCFDDDGAGVLVVPAAAVGIAQRREVYDRGHDQPGVCADEEAVGADHRSDRGAGHHSRQQSSAVGNRPAFDAARQSRRPIPRPAGPWFSCPGSGPAELWRPPRSQPPESTPAE